MAFSSELKREREMGEEELLACPFLKMAPFLMVFFFFFSLAPIDGDREREKCEKMRIGCPKEVVSAKASVTCTQKKEKSKVRRPESWA